MKPHLLKIPGGLEQSFSYQLFRQSNVHSRWHYHPEIELIHIHRGSGTQFVGNSIRRFGAGDVILVGSNLPHFWRYDDDFPVDESPDMLCSTVVHFSEGLWGDRFLQLPENRLLREAFDKLARGVLLSGGVRDRVAERMQTLRTAEGTYRLIFLLDCMVEISQATPGELTLLSSLGFRHQSSEHEHTRINAIYDYAFQHFREKIPLETIASEIGLVPNSFCRYFKSKTGKNFTDFIQEIRVGNACKLLIENRLNNKQICYESGFNNFTSFHKHFKAITGVSPQVYQKLYARQAGI